MKNTLHPLCALAGVALVSVLCITKLPAVAILIDDFSTGAQFETVLPSAPSAVSTTPAAAAIGGTRTLRATLTSPSGIGDFGVTAGGSNYALAGLNSSGLMDASLEWTPGGFDLTDGGLNDTLFIDFARLDPGSPSGLLPIVFLFTSTGGDTASLVADLAVIPAPGEVVALDLGSASLVPDFGNAAFTDTATILMSVSMGYAADFEIDSISIGQRNVPDGGSTLLMLGSVAACGAIGRIRTRILLRGRR